ncbi:hypothetical protein [Streptomyces platensis]|uniref:hypothetical protein n=1 Tax=Streptomyces platensis TaxID=58346 RepID=UPI00379D2C7A
MSQLPDNWLNERTTTLNVRQVERNYKDGYRTVETDASFRSEVCSGPGSSVSHQQEE